LAAIKVPETSGAGTIIASFGKENTAEEVERFVGVLPGVVEKLRAMA
jgi:cysteine sulfinate desulfinase/cysteine desulfurase-like protein